MKKVELPAIAVLGLSLELYHEKFPDFDAMLSGQLEKYCGEISGFSEIKKSCICFKQSQVETAVKKAENLNVDCILLIPMCYTASLMTLESVIKTDIPIVIWNTQEAAEIDDDFDFDMLLRNHVTQGTQDLTNVLLREGRIFGLESGHYKDKSSLAKLDKWLRAARACRFARRCRVGILGNAFEGMGDFAFDEDKLREKWGADIIRLNIDHFVELFEAVKDSETDKLLGNDRNIFEISHEVTEEIHRLSLKLEIAMRKLIAENNLDAFTMNFLELIGRVPTMPFLGINKLIGEGMGYAGEGDIITAALMAEMRSLAGSANFTEIYTLDYEQNLMLMTHMQECNPALARKDSKIKLVKKDFWAKGCKAYTGMHFTLEPGPVTLVCLTTDANNDFIYIVYETEIMNLQIFKKFDIPHWVIQLNEPVGDFLTRYSMAGGTHHLAAVPGRQAEAVTKLAKLHKFPTIHLNTGI
jgi:L-arabinose isomerase